MKCSQCKLDYVRSHPNQKLCSDECRKESRKHTKKKYKKSDKGLVSTRKWQESDRFKENERRYRQKPIAKKKAVERSIKHQKKSKYAQDSRKRISKLYMSRTQGKLRSWWKLESKNGCRKCGSKERLTIDHVIPRIRGGTDDLWNLQCLCFSCNARKWTK